MKITSTKAGAAKHKVRLDAEGEANSFGAYSNEEGLTDVKIECLSAQEGGRYVSVTLTIEELKKLLAYADDLEKRHTAAKMRRVA